MKSLLLLLILMAVVFGLCFGVDRLCRRLFPADPRKAVRLPRRSVIFGTLLTFLGFTALLMFWSQLQWHFRAAALFVLALGLFLLVQYFSFSIRYDDEGFAYRTLGKKPMTCRYEDILGQKSLLTRSGVNSTLYTTQGEVPVYTALVGLPDFLRKAFSRWCDAKGIDPDTVENNPQYLTYFPEP